MIDVPRKAFLTKGVGKHKEKLTSFELALRNARIAQFNLVRVSSIFPPKCRIVPVQEGLKMMYSGQIVHCVISDQSTNEPHRMIAAATGLAIPRDRENMHGYISEHHSFGETEKIAGDYAEDLAAGMLATTLGVDFDPDKSWNERKLYWKISGAIVKSTQITQTALGDKNGLWTTVVAACIFVPNIMFPPVIEG